MTYSWSTCSFELREFVYNILNGVKELLGEEFVGLYLHGSLAMGGFNPNKSDVDLLVSVHQSLSLEKKRRLAQFFLTISKKPFPVEISILNRSQLKKWTHPSPFEFHYSEYWRERYKTELERGTHFFINEKIKTDPDLAAHLTITIHRGICIEGIPISELLPLVPQTHYISSIIEDFKECLANILEDPIYCTLNLIRVYYYLKEGVIASKHEAGVWGCSVLPERHKTTIRKVMEHYSNGEGTLDSNKIELTALRNYIEQKVKELINF